jgi:hypothetical protein
VILHLQHVVLYASGDNTSDTCTDRSPVFNSTANFQLRLPLPPSTTREEVLALLHNHDFLIKMDPDIRDYNSIEPPSTASSLETKHYKVVNSMDSGARWIGSSTVSYTVEMTDLENGCHRLVHGPLGLTQESSWTVQDADDGEATEKAELALVQDCEVRCSRLLVSTVRSKTIESWNQWVKEKFVAELECSKAS